MADGTVLMREDDEKQRFTRASIICDGCLDVGGLTVPCEILDISVGGAKIATGEPLSHEGDLVLQVGDVAAFPGKVAWQRGCQSGIEFGVAPETVAEALPEILEGPAKAREQRQHLRSTVLWSAEVIHGARIIPCRILNVSAAGAKVRIEAAIPDGTEVRISCNRFGEMPARVVWGEDGKIGLSFSEDPGRVLRAIGNAVDPVRDL